MYTEKRARNSNSIEKMKLRDSINQPSQRFPSNTILRLFENNSKWLLPE